MSNGEYLTLQVESGDINKVRSTKNRIQGSLGNLEEIKKACEDIYEHCGIGFGWKHETWIYLEAISFCNWVYHSSVENMMIFKR
tara:strand:- start:548 stop:799 length:252 start_codon:yes stop_codon:yes gene_type:complete